MLVMGKVAAILVLVVLCCHGQRLFPSPLLLVTEGDNGRFTCEGNEGPMVLQINSNVSSVADVLEEEEGSGDGVYSTEYQIDNLQRSDNGTTIQCFSNGEGSNIITLIVDFPPRFSDNASYVVIEGSSPRIQLTLDAALRITSFEWIRNGERIQDEGRRRVLFSDAMVFDPISRDDTGTYEVIANDNLGSGVATVNINVYYSPEFVDGRGLVNRSVVSGDDITLNCRAFANPDVTDLTLNHDLTDSVSNVAIGSEAFVITSATSDNVGRYTCEATNPIAITTIVYNLLVGELPDVDFSLEVTVTLTSVIMDAEYTDNSDMPVLEFIVTIGNATYYVEEFPLELCITMFIDREHTYTVHAVNAIGSIEVDSGSFTIFTSGASKGCVAVSVLVLCAVMVFFLNGN